jgi:hypothetical protein
MVQNNGDITAKECGEVMKSLFLIGNSSNEMYDVGYNR